MENAPKLLAYSHRPLVSIFKKDVATLLQCIQHILLKIHQYRVQIIYKPGPKIFIAEWLSKHNHVEGKHKPIKDLDIRINTIQSVTDIPECMSISQIQQAYAQDDHLQCLKSFIIAGWPRTKEELHTASNHIGHTEMTGHNRWSHVKRQAYNHINRS